MSRYRRDRRAVRLAEEKDFNTDADRMSRSSYGLATPLLNDHMVDVAEERTSTQARAVGRKR